MRDQTTEDLLRHLAGHCAELGVSVNEALHEKIDEMAVRAFLRCVPNDYIKEARIPDFLSQVLGRAPEHELIAAVRSEKRGPAIDEDAQMELLREQRYRCALCGVVLVSAVRPQVDHVVPIALGGKSDRSNYQLLCARCNVGKSKLLGWIMGAPFIREGVGYRLRYCVLTRFRGRCSEWDCDASSRSAELEVVPLVPPHRGGRLIFDNLRVVCADHAEALRRSWKVIAISRMRFGRLSARWSPL